MELSLNKKAVFCAGSTEKDAMGISNGVIAAVQFDESMRLINEKVLSIYNVQGCTALKRMPERDDLVLGCFKHLLIVRFDGKGFIFLNKIPNVHTSKCKTANSLGIVSGLWVHNREIFSVCREDRYIGKSVFQYENKNGVEF